MDFDEARARADDKLGGRIAAIAAGRAPEVLDPFAKAYLGLFLEIDDALPRDDRVRLLASEPLAEALLSGFEALLQRDDLPDPARIGQRLARGERYPLGYPVLAGVERRLARDPGSLLDLPPATLASALCFHFANTASHRHPWVATLLTERPDLCADALTRFWDPLREHTKEFLPGLRDVLRTEGADALRGQLVPTLLEHWPASGHGVQRELLLTALRTLDHDLLLALARRRLAQGDADVKRRVYWLATAYLLAPREFAQPLLEYASRWREKTLPLLDFTCAVLGQERESGMAVAPATLAHLLRIIAPTFRRNAPATGGLDAVAGQVLSLFERLAADASDEAAAAVAGLRRVRVMGMYADVLADVQRRQSAARAG